MISIISVPGKKCKIILNDQKITSESFHGIFYTKIDLHPTPPHNNHAFWHVDISCVGVEEIMVQGVKTENNGIIA